jgi:hypothetical protein
VRPEPERARKSGRGDDRQPDGAINLMLAAATLTSPGLDIYLLEQIMSSLNAKEFVFISFCY